MINQLAPPKYTLPVIIFAQFTGTSLWFAGNAVLPDLQTAYGLPEGALGSAPTLGSALTLVNCLGFTITIASIQLLSLLYQRWEAENTYIVLFFGPLPGIMAARRLLR